MKRLVTVFLSLCVFSVSYGLVFTVDKITYTTLDDSSVKVTGFSFSLVDVVIPSEVTYQNVIYQVKEIGNRGLVGYKNSSSSKMETLVISEGIEKIGLRGVNSNSKLKSVTLPNSLIEIGANAFSSLSSLMVVDFPNGSNLKTIGDEAFYNCAKLETFSIPSSVEYIGEKAFRSDKKLNSIIIIPENVSVIPFHCFYGCSSLSTVVLHDHISRIEERAFDGCTALENIDTEFLETVDYIGPLAFSYVPGIRHLVLSGKLGTISASCFHDCKNLEYVWLKEGITSVSLHAFGSCRNLKYIVLPSSLETVGAGAFGENTALLDYVDHDPRTFFFLAETPFSIEHVPTTDGGNAYPSLGKIVAGDKLYVKESAMEAYKTKWKSYKKNIDYMIPFNADLTYSTNYREFDMDFHITAINGNKPFVATCFKENSVTFTSLDDYIVPAETGVVIRKISDENTWFQIAELQDNTLSMNNYLKGVTYSEMLTPTTDDGDVNYVLYNGVFCQFSNAGMFGDHKAFLQLPSQTAGVSLSFNFDNDSDGIIELNHQSDRNDTIYNINGVRILNPQKGLYIKNGKKIIIK